MKLQGLAAAWFRREDWQRWCEIDRDFQPDYNHWLRRMEKKLTQLKAAGVPTIKTVILPDEFLAWSQANNKGVGTADRAHYAAHKAMAHNKMETRS